MKLETYSTYFGMEIAMRQEEEKNYQRRKENLWFVNGI